MKGILISLLVAIVLVLLRVLQAIERLGRPHGYR